MGRRAQVVVTEQKGAPDIYLYTHWGAGTLENDVAFGLVQGKERWRDSEYLARIILDSLGGRSFWPQCNRLPSEDGFGIGTVLHSDIEKLITISLGDQQVKLEIIHPTPEEIENKVAPIQTWSFKEFCRGPLKNSVVKEQKSK